MHWGGRLVLLDEPFAALGVQQTRRGLELIEQIRRRGVAIVVITHNVLHAFQVADRIVVLRHGRVAGERAVARPRTRRSSAWSPATSAISRCPVPRQAGGSTDGPASDSLSHLTPVSLVSQYYIWY